MLLWKLHHGTDEKRQLSIIFSFWNLLCSICHKLIWEVWGRKLWVNIQLYVLLSPRAGSLSPVGALSAILTLAYPFLIAQFTNYLRVPVPHLGSWWSFPWVPAFLASVPPWKISSISAILYNKISTNKNPSVKKYIYILYIFT